MFCHDISGDIGMADEQGYFIISDRIKELIKYKGYQVVNSLYLQHNWQAESMGSLTYLKKKSQYFCCWVYSNFSTHKVSSLEQWLVLKESVCKMVFNTK